MYTDLTYINQAYASDVPPIVITQHNLLDPATVSAWLVIKECGYNWRYPFRFAWGLSVQILTSAGNALPATWMPYGGILSVDSAANGHFTLNLNETPDPMNITVNNHSDQAINVHIYRGEHQLAVRPQLSSDQSAQFRFDYTLHCIACRNIAPGQPIALDPSQSLNPPLDLFGLRRGRILLTGGGAGAHAKPLQFHLLADETW